MIIPPATVHFVCREASVRVNCAVRAYCQYFLSRAPPAPTTSSCKFSDLMVDTTTPGASTAPSGAEDDDFDIVNAEEVDGVEDTTADEDDDAIPDLDEDDEVKSDALQPWVFGQYSL